ncbi:lysozyme inhibitor LprI family protein [Adhaeribacter pallidiroseus]|uniref:Lysozyme inhibitor LprI-like N-terminal domain-containing protein n=1 Tax=Adhaeribacter pallidiroseus TaxID=2072847 RepID=A0A369QVF0_9BACT|nr:lysozyme inhibitor LprI family protein [Adhaeribacter pallidiroseus]RDC66158.1 hypothetical protein AHMF7616_04789 [Adhaeribacter pallidiroseus]
MRQILTMLFVLISSVVYSQNNEIITNQKAQLLDRYNFDDDCGNGAQQDINICLGKAIEKLEKLLFDKYRCLISSLDMAIQKNSLEDKQQASEYKKIKKAIITSQKTFEKLKKQNTIFYLSYYREGTERPMFFGLSKIQDLKDRLNRLDDYLETLEQDNVIKCK